MSAPARATADATTSTLRSTRTDGDDRSAETATELGAPDDGGDRETTTVVATVQVVAVTNTGAATHDFLIGDQATQEEHGAEMAAGMTHGHDACPEAADEHMDRTVGLHPWSR